MGLLSWSGCCEEKKLFPCWESNPDSLALQHAARHYTGPIQQARTQPVNIIQVNCKLPWDSDAGLDLLTYLNVEGSFRLNYLEHVFHLERVFLQSLNSQNLVQGDAAQRLLTWRHEAHRHCAVLENPASSYDTILSHYNTYLQFQNK